MGRERYSHPGQHHHLFLGKSRGICWEDNARMILLSVTSLEQGRTGDAAADAGRSSLSLDELATESASEWMCMLGVKGKQLLSLHHKQPQAQLPWEWVSLVLSQCSGRKTVLPLYSNPAFSFLPRALTPSLLQSLHPSFICMAWESAAAEGGWLGHSPIPSRGYVMHTAHPTIIPLLPCSMKRPHVSQ